MTNSGKKEGRSDKLGKVRKERCDVEQQPPHLTFLLYAIRLLEMNGTAAFSIVSFLMIYVPLASVRLEEEEEKEE